MNRVIRHALFAATALVATGFSTVASATDDPGGWQWIVAPYGWVAGVRTDLHTGRPPNGGISTDEDFGSIVDKIDGAFQIHIEGQNDQFGMFTDYTYLGLADHHDRPRFHTESDLDTQLFELAGVWNPGEGRYNGWDLFAGLRYLGTDFTAKLVPTNPMFDTTRIKEDESYSDFMLGVRYTWALSERWGLTLRGDASFGQTDGTWNVSAVTNYKTKNGAWFFGYRYLDVKLKPGVNSLDIVTSGPLIGYGFKF